MRGRHGEATSALKTYDDVRRSVVAYLRSKKIWAKRLGGDPDLGQQIARERRGLQVPGGRRDIEDVPLGIRIASVLVAIGQDPVGGSEGVHHRR